MGEKSVQEEFLGEESLGEKCIGEKYVQEDFLGEESLGKKSVQEEFLGEGSLGEKYGGEKSVQEEFLGEESLGEKYMGEKYCARRLSGWKVYGWKVLCEKSFWVKSLWVKGIWVKCARRVSGWRVSGWKVLGKIGVDGMLAFVSLFSGFCIEKFYCIIYFIFKSYCLIFSLPSCHRPQELALPVCQLISCPKRSKGTLKIGPNLTSETRLKLRLFSLLRMFATSCGQQARQSQRAWLCGTCATAKHHLISCPKRSKGTLKIGPNLTFETRLKLRLFSLLRMFATSCGQQARQSQRAWLCGTCATAKHHLISCPKRSKGTLKIGPNLTSETRLKLRLFSLLRMFATSCGQQARQSQRAWLCGTCATAKHHLISCPKRSKGTLFCQAQAAWLSDVSTTAKHHLCRALISLRAPPCHIHLYPPAPCNRSRSCNLYFACFA